MFMVFRNISLILWHKIPSSEDRRFSRSGMDGFKTWKVQSKRWNKRWENHWKQLEKMGGSLEKMGEPLEKMGE